MCGRGRNSALLRSLLEQLDRICANKRRIHLVLDNAAIHKSRAVREYLRQKGDRFNVWFLPPLCPGPNPAELEWQTFHAAVATLASPDDTDALIARVNRYLTDPPSQPTTSPLSSVGPDTYRLACARVTYVISNERGPAQQPVPPTSPARQLALIVPSVSVRQTRLDTARVRC